MLKLISVLTVILLSIKLIFSLPPEGLVSVNLVPDVDYHCCFENEPINWELPKVYCFDGTSQTLMDIWKTASAVVEMKKPEKYEVFEGRDEFDVWAQFESSQSRWGFNIFNWGRRSIALNPFEATCLGIRSSKNYTLKVQVTRINELLVGMTTLGALIFFMAPILVHNQLFYYIIGIAFGVVASILICLYFIISFLPLKRPAMLGMMAGGSTIVLYFFQSLLDNLLVLIPMYPRFVYGYLIASGLISFGVCYRFGPLSNRRSKNLIQWSLQILSLALVFCSSYIKEVTVTMVIFIILLHRFPITKYMIIAITKILGNAPNKKELVPRRSKTYTFATPGLNRKSRFLTEEEYREQGRVETDRGLWEMRQYCMTVPLKGSIKRIDPNNVGRFAKFMTGESHVSEEEIEAKMREEILSEDDD